MEGRTERDEVRRITRHGISRGLSTQAEASELYLEDLRDPWEQVKCSNGTSPVVQWFRMRLPTRRGCRFDPWLGN